MRGLRRLKSLVSRTRVHAQPASPVRTPAAQPGAEQFRAEFQKTDERAAFFSGNGLRISIAPDKTYPHTRFRIERADGAVFDEFLYYSHLALGRLLTDYEFSSALEIGSAHGIVARALAFAGKKVSAIDILNIFDAAATGDYLDLKLPEPIDAIWCSHTLEHQRHLGRFLEKSFDDLREGGVLAITVPSALGPLIIGHCNIFTPGHMLYNLILAGFDCSEARVKTYDWRFSILVKKKPNGLPRISFATTNIPSGDDLGYCARLAEFFPPYFRDRFGKDNIAWGEVEAINW